MTGAPIVHVLSQYAWPDDAPTGIYAEQLADALSARAFGCGSWPARGDTGEGRRPAPRTPVERVPYRGRRERLPLGRSRVRVRAARLRAPTSGGGRRGRRRGADQRAADDTLPAPSREGAGCDGRLLAAGLLPAADPGGLGPARAAAPPLHRLWTRQLREWPTSSRPRATSAVPRGPTRSSSATGTPSSWARRGRLGPARRSTPATSAGGTTSLRFLDAVPDRWSRQGLSKSRCAATAPG